MRKGLLLLFASITFFSCLSLPDPMETSVQKDTVAEKQIYVAMKFSSDMDLDSFFEQFKLIPKEYAEAKGYHGMALELVKLESAVIAEYSVISYASWGEYTVFQLRPGSYLLTSSKYPPSLEQRGISFDYDGSIPLEVGKESPFVYLGDIQLIFVPQNEFGQTDLWVEIRDNYEDSLDQLRQWILDKDGNYITPVNRTQPTGKIPFTMVNR